MAKSIPTKADSAIAGVPYGVCSCCWDWNWAMMLAFEVHGGGAYMGRRTGAAWTKVGKRAAVLEGEGAGIGVLGLRGV